MDNASKALSLRISVPRGEKDSSCWMLYVRMGNYIEVLEMPESVREIHDASSQSCSSLLVKKPNALV